MPANDTRALEIAFDRHSGVRFARISDVRQARGGLGHCARDIYGAVDTIRPHPRRRSFMGAEDGLQPSRRCSASWPWLWPIHRGEDMISEDPKFGQHDCGADAAAYVLGALESHEADAFRRHLRACALCRDEVAAFRAVVEALPVTARRMQLPRQLRRRVIANVHSEPRATASGERRLRPVSVRPVLAAGLAVVIAAAIATGTLLSSGGPAKAKVIRATVTAPRASAYVRVVSGHAELVVQNLPAPPAGKIYEVWLEREGAAAPSPTGTLFGVTSTGSGSANVPGAIRGIGKVLVTPEPLGGSAAPTHTPVIVAQLG